MNARILIASLIVISGIGVCSSYSQTIPPGVPHLSTSVTDTAVTFDTTSQVFRYVYTVRNSSLSTGGITTYEVDITTTSGKFPSGTNLQNPATGYLQTTSSFNTAALGASIIPVGIEGAPAGWGSGIDSNGVVDWSQDPPAGAPILAGTTLSSFALSSHGTPGIRRFTTKAYFDIDEAFKGQGIDEVPPDQFDQSLAAQGAAYAAATMMGYTVGPVCIPSSDNGQMIASLISLKHQSVSLGWLRGDEFVKNLDDKLDQAQKALSKSHGFQAREKLTQFIHMLDQQRKRQTEDRHDRDDGHDRDNEHGGGARRDGEDKTYINGNAFYMLKANAEFIISKLPAKPAADDGDQGGREGHDGR